MRRDHVAGRLIAKEHVRQRGQGDVVDRGRHIMNESFDWTSYSDDPNDERARKDVLSWLLSRRQVHLDQDLLDYVCDRARNKSVLDIGVVSHSAGTFDDPGWRHGRIKKVASKCIGLDILEPLVRDLNQRGFDVRVVDATSNADLDERFEMVFIGDTIEHVENPVALLKFAGRHLTPEGRVLVTTPNPFSRKFYRRFRRLGTAVVNLDHCGWFTPTTALELGRRAGISFVGYHLAKKYTPFGRWRHRIAWQFSPLEFAFPDYIFEFARPSEH
jgi:2-polyprenyl-3-methyl-5-hydroxy-6-metoxy-1,4-benzoquinol methylase